MARAQHEECLCSAGLRCHVESIADEAQAPGATQTEEEMHDVLTACVSIISGLVHTTPIKLLN